MRCPSERAGTGTIQWYFMHLQETVEAEGHLIDSHVMESIFDKVVECGGRFEVEQFRIGRTNSDPSYLRLNVQAATREALDRLLQQLIGLGCTPAEAATRCCAWWSGTVAPRRTSTPPPTIALTYATAATGSRLENQRMDALLVVTDGRAVCRRLRDIQRRRPCGVRACAASA